MNSSNEISIFGKKETIMTRGFAIICMVVLHLFCRIGKDIFGTPLLWISNEVPLVYLFGFFAEICVPIYLICTGYGQELFYESEKISIYYRFSRIIKLMINYWIVLGLFSIVGLIIRNEVIPGNINDLIKSLFLLHSYNGAWWYLHSYILLLLIPTNKLLKPVHKLKCFSILIFCSLYVLVWYLLGRTGFLLSHYVQEAFIKQLVVEVENLLGILPMLWLGAAMCKYGIFEMINDKLDNQIFSKKYQRVFILLFIFLFIISNIIHKAIVMPFVAIFIFILFNLIKKVSIWSNCLCF